MQESLSWQFTVVCYQVKHCQSVDRLGVNDRLERSRWLMFAYGTACFKFFKNLLCILSPTNLPPTVGYLCSCMCLHHRWRLLCHHKLAIWCSFLPSAFSSVLYMVLFLRSSCCFPNAVKTRSIPPPDTGQPWNCLHILPTSEYVRFTWVCPDNWSFQ